ncbi:MAG: hypothetical protein JO015_08375 [Verrucomicrobia bacterium]|nr:hypothetical protein [Verrucomicrobiota bacterium]
MSFVQGCTGDVSTQVAVEASRTRAVLEARARLSEPERQQNEKLLETLRSEILRFATFFRHAIADDISRHDPAKGVYEAQRFENWLKLNDTSVLPTFEDKVFLQSTHEAAVQVMRASSTNLPSDQAGMIKRLATLEDAIPIADEYRRWQRVLAVVQRYAALFNGLPAVGLVLLLAFVLPVIVFAVAAVLPRSGLPHPVIGVLTMILSVLGLGIALAGLLGPLVRARIMARLHEKLAITEKLVPARITPGQALSVLTSVRQKLAALDPGFATRHEILPEQMLAPLRAEIAFLQAKLGTRHLAASSSACNSPRPPSTHAIDCELSKALKPSLPRQSDY